MARSRMIKPEFWRSPTLAELDREVRLFFIGLWQVADDQGNGPADPVLLGTELFPHDLVRDATGVLSECSRGLTELDKHGHIRLYEVDGRRYYTVPKFHEHQTINRPSAPKYPAPEMGKLVKAQPILSEDSVSAHDPLTLKLTEEKLTEEKADSHNPTAEAFASFYEKYPRKVKKRTAESAFIKALQRADAETIIQGAEKFANDPNLPEARFIPHPSTWLNADSWEDEALPDQGRSSEPPSSYIWD